MTDSEILAILLRMLIVMSQISLTVTPFRTWYVILVILTTVFWFWHVKTRIITLSTEKILGHGLGGTHTRTSCKLNWCVLSESCAGCPVLVRHCKVFFVFLGWEKKMFGGVERIFRQVRTIFHIILTRLSNRFYAVVTWEDFQSFLFLVSEVTDHLFAGFYITSSKIKLNKLLIFPKFYIYEFLEPLRTNIYTSFKLLRERKSLWWRGRESFL